MRGTPTPTRRVLRLLRPYLRHQRRAGVVAVGLILAGTVVGLAKPWPLKFLFDRLLGAAGETEGSGTTSGSDIDGLFLVAVAGAVIGLAAVDAGLGFARQYVLRATGQRVGFGLRSALFERLQRLSLAFHDRRPTGELVNRVTRDVEKVTEVVTDNLVEAVSNVVVLAGMLVVMATLDPELTVVVALFSPLLFLANARFRHRLAGIEETAREAEGDVAAFTSETIATVRQVQAFGREDLEAERFADRAGSALGASLRVTRAEAAFGAWVDLLPALALAVLLVRGAQRVDAGAITPGDLVVFVAYLRDFYSPTRALSKVGARITRASVRAERLDEILSADPAVRNEPGATGAPVLRGHVRLDGVTFAYGDSAPVLSGVDLEIAPGQVAALVGATGAGKSTIAALLLRLWDPTEGAVLLDGVDIRRWRLDSLRSQVAVVLQDSVLLRASVAENIAYGRPSATRAEIEAASRAAGAHGFVGDLPDGYDTMVGERGATLSGGQRQRLAIARALVRDAPLLILDEPTTGLDVATEGEVLDALDRLMAGRTALVIAHRLSTVRRADVIFVLDGGRIVERGTHAELVAAEGPYARLVRLDGAPRPTSSRLARRTAISGPGRDGLRAAVEAHWSLGRVENWSPLPAGRANISLLLTTSQGRFVARRSHERKTLSSLEFELDLLRHLARLEFPAPQVVATDEGREWVSEDGAFVVVTEFCPGSDFDKTDPRHLRAAGRILANYHACVRSMPGVSGPPGPWSAELSARGAALLQLETWAAGALDSTEQAGLVEASTGLSARLGDVASRLTAVEPLLPHLIVHGSYGPTSLTMTSRGDASAEVAAVFDFDRSFWGPRVLDVAYAGKAFCRSVHGEGGWVGLDPGRVGVLLDAYTASEPLTDAERDSLALVLCAQRLTRLTGKATNAVRKHPLPAPEEARKVLQAVEREVRRLRWVEESGARVLAAAARP